MSTKTQHTSGPVAWQKFGESWYLTGQYGMRPIILSIGPSQSNHRKRDFKLLDANGLLIDFYPDHPDAQFIVRAYNSHDELLAACKAALRYLKDYGGDGEPLAYEACENAIAKAEAA